MTTEIVDSATAGGRARQVGRGAVLCMYVNAALNAAVFASYCIHFAERPRDPMAVVTVFGISSSIVFLVSVGAFTTGAIFFLYWLREADAAARRLHPGILTHRPAWTIYSFIIPIMNVSEPLEITKKIWSASNYKVPAESTEPERARSVPVYVDGWWVSFLLGFCFFVFETNLKHSPERWFLGASSRFLLAASALLAVKLIRDISTLQIEADGARRRPEHF